MTTILDREKPVTVEVNLREDRAARQEAQPAGQATKIAYIMSRFPKITETFILYEMLAMEEQGVQVEVYPLRRERTSVVHPEAKPYVARAHFLPHFSWPILRSQLRFLARQPRTYLSTLWTLLRANLGSRRYLAGAIFYFPKAVHFAEQMAQQGIDHVHAHFASHPAMVAFVIHRLTGISYSFTAHGSDLHRDQHMLREKVAEAAFVVAISQYNRALILEKSGDQFQDKVLVIHCGVDTAVFQPREEATPFERGEGPFSVACVGTLHEVKGQKYLLQACRILQERGIQVHCHLVGDGPDQAMLEAEAKRLGIQEQVHFHGRRTREEIAQLLRRVDVLATPSVPTRSGRREGIPVVLMEAMASAVPVVASRLSGIPELVEDRVSGLLVPPGDAQALADALAQLHDQDAESRWALGRAGREKVVQEFDVHRNSAALARYFLANRQGSADR